MGAGPIHRSKFMDGGGVHLFLEPVDDLDVLVEPVRPVVPVRGLGILQSPRAVRPHMDLAHRTDDAGHEDFLDRAPRGQGVALIAHLRRQLRVLRGGLADEPGLPDVVGERLLAVDVLAVRQRQIGGERVRVLRGRDDDGVEVVRVVEDAPEIVELLGARKTLRRGVHGGLVHVAENDDVLVRMRRRGVGAALAPRVCRPRRDGELAEARHGATAAGDVRDVQLVVQVPAPQQRRGSCDDPRGRHGPADELAARYLARARLLGRLLHDPALRIHCVVVSLEPHEPIVDRVGLRPRSATSAPAARPDRRCDWKYLPGRTHHASEGREATLDASTCLDVSRAVRARPIAVEPFCRRHS